MKRDCYPLEICLPDGKRAEYVAENRPARYTVDGELTDIDVSIPDDLAQAGWYWSGSFLYQPWPGRVGAGAAISTALYGPPGYPSDRQTCFEVARQMDATHAGFQATRAAKPPKKPKAVKQAPVVPEPIVEQMELAL